MGGAQVRCRVRARRDRLPGRPDRVCPRRLARVVRDRRGQRALPRGRRARHRPRRRPAGGQRRVRHPHLGHHRPPQGHRRHPRRHHQHARLDAGRVPAHPGGPGRAQDAGRVRRVGVGGVLDPHPGRDPRRRPPRRPPRPGLPGPAGARRAGHRHPLRARDARPLPRRVRVPAHGRAAHGQLRWRGAARRARRPLPPRVRRPTAQLLRAHRVLGDRDLPRLRARRARHDRHAHPQLACLRARSGPATGAGRRDRRAVPGGRPARPRLLRPARPDRRAVRRRPPRAGRHPYVPHRRPGAAAGGGRPGVRRTRRRPDQDQRTAGRTRRGRGRPGVGARRRTGRGPRPRLRSGRPAARRLCDRHSGDRSPGPSHGPAARPHGAGERVRPAVDPGDPERQDRPRRPARPHPAGERTCPRDRHRAHPAHHRRRTPRQPRTGCGRRPFRPRRGQHPRHPARQPRPPPGPAPHSPGRLRPPDGRAARPRGHGRTGGPARRGRPGRRTPRDTHGPAPRRTRRTHRRLRPVPPPRRRPGTVVRQAVRRPAAGARPPRRPAHAGPAHPARGRRTGRGLPDPRPGRGRGRAEGGRPPRAVAGRRCDGAGGVVRVRPAAARAPPLGRRRRLLAHPAERPHRGARGRRAVPARDLVAPVGRTPRCPRRRTPFVGRPVVHPGTRPRHPPPRPGQGLSRHGPLGHRHRPGRPHRHPAGHPARRLPGDAGRHPARRALGGRTAPPG